MDVQFVGDEVIYLFFLMRQSLALVTQAEVQWQSQLTATSASWVKVILLPQPTE